MEKYHILISPQNYVKDSRNHVILIQNLEAIFVPSYEKTVKPVSLSIVPDRIHWIYDQCTYLQRRKTGNPDIF